MKIDRPRYKLTVFLILAAVCAILYRFKVPCAVRTILHIPCPGCGMTRAWLAFLHLDLRSAFFYHPMFWSVPILFIYFLFEEKTFKNDNFNKTVPIALLFGFLLTWVIRLVAGIAV